MQDDFYDKVYALVRQIPRGRVSTYGTIARAIGSPQSARVVGYAMNNAHSHPEVPAHRVVNRNGQLTGKHHFSSSDAMQNLLEEEGVRVVDDQVQEFESRCWSPS